MEMADAMICDLFDENRLGSGEQMPLSRKPCDLVHVLNATVEGLAERYGERFMAVCDAGPVPRFGMVRRSVGCQGTWRGMRPSMASPTARAL